MRQPITLVTSIEAPGRGLVGAPSNKVELIRGGFPLEIPAGWYFDITHILLINKYPWDPLRYNNGGMASMYFQTSAITVPSHHPEVHFDPPYRYRGLSPFRGFIANGQTEAQYIFAMVQGWLESPEEG